MRSAIRSSNRQAWPTRRTSASRGTGFAEAKMAASTRSIHSRQRAAGGRSRSSTSRGSSPSRRRRRAAALIGRTAGTSAGPKTRARRRARRGGRTAGGRRGRSSARGGPLRRARRNLGQAGGRRFSGPVSSAVWARRRSGCSSGGERSAARSRAEAAASAIAPAAAFGQAGSPGLDRRAGARQAQGRIQDFRCDQRNGPRPAQPNGDDACRTPKAPKFRMGPLGRPGGRRTPGRRPLRPPKPDRPPLRKPSGLLQGRSGPRPGPAAPLRRKIRLGSRLGGRLGAVAPERQEVRRRSERVADRETEVTQRGGVGVEAQDFGAGRGALQRQASAQGPGGGRIGAQSCVEQSEPGAGGKQRLALPCPSARPRPGRDRRRRWKGLVLRGFRLRGALCGEPAETAPKGAPERAQAVRRGGRDRRESLGYDEFLRGGLSRCVATESAPLVVGWRCPISLPYRTRF